jgi:hypothetical protein
MTPAEKAAVAKVAVLATEAVLQVKAEAAMAVVAMEVDHKSVSRRNSSLGTPEPDA